MRRILFSLLAIFLISVGTVACGPETGEVDNDDNQSANNGNQNNGNQNNDNNSNGYDEAQSMAESLGKFVDVVIAGSDFECQCTTETVEEEEQCFDGAPTSSDREELVTCVADVINDYHTAPPQVAVEYFECLEEIMEDTLDCIDDVYAEYDDICSLEGAGDFEQCFLAMDDEMASCESDFADNDVDGAAEEWSEGIDPYMSDAGCMDLFE
jgi:hypothetical protein